MPDWTTPPPVELPKLLGCKTVVFSMTEEDSAIVNIGKIDVKVIDYGKRA
jgi:hypothetical protein